MPSVPCSLAVELCRFWRDGRSHDDIHPLNNLEHSQILFSLVYFTNYAFLAFIPSGVVRQRRLDLKDVVQMLFNVEYFYYL